jgi:hypothetical protein
MALPAHVLQVVQVTLTSVSNEGHFSLEAQTVFRPYLPKDCSGVTVIPHGTACAWATSNASYAEVGQYRRALYSGGQRSFSSACPLGLEWGN